MKQLDIWQSLIIILLMVLSTFGDIMSVGLFMLLLAVFFPFFKKNYYIVEIGLLLSTISYYFCGADEQIFSIHTIYIVCLIFGAILHRRFNKANLVIPRLLLLGVFVVSYKESTLSTFNGLMELIYVVGISLSISFFFNFNVEGLFSRLPLLAAFVIVFCCLMLFFFRISDGQRMTFTAEVNANSFGFCSAIMTTIIATNIITSSTRNSIYSHLFGIVGFILTFLSGSRTSLMACVVSIIVVLLLASNNFKKSVQLFLYFILFGLISLVLIPMFGLDTSRFSLTSVIESGGSNRTHIWEEIIPYVQKNYLWLGYGPGKAGSTELLTSFVGRVYNSTHNTFIECFAETGLCGLFCFIPIILGALNNYRKIVRYNNAYYIPFSMLICVLFASSGESYYNDIIIWMLIGLSTFNPVKNIQDNINIQ